METETRAQETRAQAEPPPKKPRTKSRLEGAYILNNDSVRNLVAKDLSPLVMALQKYLGRAQNAHSSLKRPEKEMMTLELLHEVQGQEDGMILKYVDGDIVVLGAADEAEVPGLGQHYDGPEGGGAE
ncbi:hypothetical protein HK102_005383 [Quaeritorhiza haematococci]|nr:hypothetical protein HK102_005383 [Quaeritorhiza haematococci]